MVPLTAGTLIAQSDSIDYKDTRQYEIGYEIGSWLPFIVIFGLALLVIIRTYRLSRRPPGES